MPVSLSAPRALFIASCLLFTLAPASASAQNQQDQKGQGQGGPTPNSLTIGLGAGVSNRYIGADSFLPQPFPSVEYIFDGGRALRTSQFGFELDLTRGNKVDFGPILRINTGRDDWQSAGDSVVEALDPVNATLELGGYVSTGVPLSFDARGVPELLLTARASVVQATGGHDGMLIEASTGLVKPSATWTFVTSLSATYASGAYQDAFFSVDMAGSTASGLAEFDAGAGLRDVGVTGVVSYRFSPKWSATSVLSYSRLIGDAADSPIVSERGTPNQLLFGFNVAYTFF